MVDNVEHLDAAPAKTNATQLTGESALAVLKGSAYPNLLHKFSSYTYNLSLHMVPREQYNEFAKKSKTGYTPRPGNVLIAAAGRWPTTMTDTSQKPYRNEHFHEDFFFENFNIETIIGMTASAQNANAIRAEFDIIEPYGMTLINRLLLLKNSLDTTDSKEDNVMQLPFLIQIDFIGYDENGIPTVLSDITKYIPIQLIGVTFKVSTKGTEYKINAVPFNHQALYESTASTPIKLQVTATDLKTFFNANTPIDLESMTLVSGTNLPSQQAELESSAAKSETYTNTLTAARNRSDQPDSNRVVIDKSVKQESERVETVKARRTAELNSASIAATKAAGLVSYTAGVNIWQQINRLRGVVKHADQIGFVFHELPPDGSGATPPSLNTATFIEPAKINKDNSAQAAPQDAAKNEAKQEELLTRLDTDNRVVMNIGQGTSVLNVINMAILNSSFIRDQLIPKDAKLTVKLVKEFLAKDFYWFKVTPSIYIGEYDPLTKRYARAITYNIIPFKVHQDKEAMAPRTIPKVIAKNYNYIFTGQNSDIISFNLDFDTQFYVVNVANPQNANTTANSKDSQQPTSKTDIQKLLSQSDDTPLNANEVDFVLANIDSILTNGEHASLTSKMLVTASAPPSNSATRSGDNETIKQVSKNILSAMGGDLISVQLKIVGDPDFIKQDDIFFGHADINTYTYKNSNDINKQTSRLTPNGSITTDTEEVFVRLSFNTPTDYNNDGLMNLSKQDIYHTNMFNGLYKVLSVKNSFNNGKFEQDLSLIRYAAKDGDIYTTTSQNRREQQPSNITNSTLKIN